MKAKAVLTRLLFLVVSLSLFAMSGGCGPNEQPGTDPSPTPSRTAPSTPSVVVPSRSPTASSTPLIVTATATAPTSTATIPFVVMTVVPLETGRATVPFLVRRSATPLQGNTPTPSNTPTPTPTRGRSSFRDSNPTAPEDILDEIGYFGGGAGSPDCSGTFVQSPTIFFSSRTAIPQVGDRLIIHVCGLASEGELVDVRVDFPIHRTREAQLTSFPYLLPDPYPNPGEKYQVEYHFLSDLYDPLGTYHVVFRGNGWVLEQDFTLSVITSPRLFLREQQLILAGFGPNEKVRVFVYDASGPATTRNISLLGWKEFQTEANGWLTIFDVDYIEGAYAAIGSLSGEVFFDQWNGDSSIRKWYDQ